MKVLNMRSCSLLKSAVLNKTNGYSSLFFLFCVMVFSLIFQTFQPFAMATHFRYGTLTWEKRTDLGANTVAISLTAAFRRNGYSGSASDGYPQIGDVITENIGGSSLSFGDGYSTGTLNFEVTSYDTAENWIIGKAEISGSSHDKVIIHTYPGSTTYTAYVQTCCRLSSSDSHKNNPDGYYRLQTTVDLSSNNSPPVSSGFPIVTVEQNSNVSFNVPATDIDGDTLTWRLSTAIEASGFSGGFTQPSGLTINGSTGAVSWNTTSASLGYYSTQVTIGDGKAGIPVDFFIQVTQQTTNNTPKFDVPPTPSDGTAYTVKPGEEVKFTVQASDQDSGDTVSLNHAGLPSGATFNIPTAANPVSSEFSWTPTVDDIGSYVVSFKAVDKKGLSVSHSINITVPDSTPPTVSVTTPANGDTNVAVNSAITATFSEVMDASTITTATFVVSVASSNIIGAISYNGTTAQFTPASDLSYSTTYTANITTGAKDTAGNAMATDYAWSFTTGRAPDTTPPEVSATSPANGDTGVAVNGNITATFSEEMDANTITMATFVVSDGTSDVTGAVSYNGTTAQFTPLSELSYSTSYTAKITTGVKDTAGNAMASDYTWSFTTGTAPDTTPPIVIATSPANGETGIAANGAIIATFSEEMDASTITTATFVVSDGSSDVSGAVSYNGTTAQFTPLSDLSYSTTYTAKITSEVKDTAGNAMSSDFTWSFITGSAPDTTPPTVIATSPANGDTGVAVNSAIIAAFSEEMDASTITTAMFVVSDGTSDVSGAVSYSGTTAQFTPLSELSYSTTYTAKITTGVKDIAGNAMSSDFTWRFITTLATPSPTPTPTPTPAEGTGIIYGFVNDESELPLRNVSMSLSGPGGYSASTSTDEDGYYFFEDLPEGDYTLTASKSGYNTETVEISLDEDEVYEAKTIMLEESVSATIYGYVLDIRGEPIENARLTIKGLRNKYTARTASDKDGFFEFTGLEAGKYLITVKKKRYKPVKTTVEVDEGESKEIEIELRATKTRTILPEESASADGLI